MTTAWGTLGKAAKPRNPDYSVGKKHRIVNAVTNIAFGSMLAGDTVELAGPFSFGTRIARLMAPNGTPTLTGFTSAKLGFMTKDGNGNLVAIATGANAVLWNAIDPHIAIVGAVDLLMNYNTALDTTKNIGELLALNTDQEPANGCFLVLTCTNVPTAANLALNIDVHVEEATTK